MGACLNGGMIAGPGSLLWSVSPAGQLSVQAPFMFAAAINRAGISGLLFSHPGSETHNANQVSDEIKNETITQKPHPPCDMITNIGIASCLFHHSIDWRKSSQR